MLFLFFIFYVSGGRNKGNYNIERYHAENLLEKGEISAFQKITLGIPIDINNESVNGLTAIPGIGKSLAQTIENERIKRNGYKNIDELKSLPGIGDKLFLKITPYVRI